MGQRVPGRPRGGDGPARGPAGGRQQAGPSLAHLNPYCRGAASITGFWTPKAVMKMLTTTMMKTRPVARLLRKSSLACFAGLLRSYLTVGGREPTLHRGLRRLGPAATLGPLSRPAASAPQPLLQERKLRGVRLGAEETARGPGVDLRAQRAGAERTQAGAYLSTAGSGLVTVTWAQSPALTPTSWMRQPRPAGVRYLPEVTQPAVEVSPDPPPGGRTTS